MQFLGQEAPFDFCHMCFRVNSYIFVEAEIKNEAIIADRRPLAMAPGCWDEGNGCLDGLLDLIYRNIRRPEYWCRELEQQPRDPKYEMREGKPEGQ